MTRPGQPPRPAQARRAATDEIIRAIGDLSGQERAHVYAPPATRT
ncbi:hypothetical protein PV963_36185 [Streptomyces coeruleorubidus]|nr:hypothetical protein [Streptomyces coeruleorubidus]WDV55417.1 hypothetical protein PV963_36185 [Streptomyces coeruleorubidus]